MGYVGLPLGLSFDSEGYDVVGYDTDERKIRALNRGTDPMGEVGDDAIERSDVSFTDDVSEIEPSEYYGIAVPTPVDESGRPDLSFIEAAGETVGRHLVEGSTVVLESTVYPGATRNVLVPTIERESGLAAGRGFYVGYSPERAVPGDPDRGLRNVVKLVSGLNEPSLRRIRELYDDVVDAGTYPVPTMETAEAAKCLENTQRDVNIALVNEFAMGCRALDVPIDPRDVIEAASTKWNFHEYRPGLVGGHCIPVDPYYLIWKFEQQGFTADVMETARKTNDRIAAHVVELVTEALAERARVLDRRTATVGEPGEQLLAESPDRHPKLLLLGVAYKPNTNDIRSPVLGDIVERLSAENVDVAGYDPLASDDDIREQFDVPVRETLSGEDVDVLLLGTSHDRFRSLDLAAIHGEMNERPALVDVTGTVDRIEAAEHGFIYREL